MSVMFLTPEFIAAEISNLDYEGASEKDIEAIDARVQEVLFGDYYLTQEIFGVLDQAIHDQNLPEKS